MWERTHFLQAVFSYEYKQNIGFAAVYGELAGPESVAGDEYFRPFNTNPVTSSFVIPFLARLREQGAGAEEFERAKAFLSTSFAATGDRFAWFLLRPLAGLMGATVLWVLPGASWLGVLTLLLVYNVPQLRLRSRLWKAGGRGDSPAAEVQRISRMSETVRRAGLAATGFAAVAVLAREPFGHPEAVGFMALAILISLPMLKRFPRSGTWIALGFLGLTLTLNHGLR